MFTIFTISLVVILLFVLLVYCLVMDDRQSAEWHADTRKRLNIQRAQVQQMAAQHAERVSYQYTRRGRV